MSDPLRYMNSKFVVESTHGSYTEPGWTYITSRESLDEAKKIVDVFGPEGYRVYDNEKGQVIYPSGT